MNVLTPLIESPELKYRRTKIVATLGPASSDAQGIEDLINLGVNVFRLNMSHGDHQIHRQTIAFIRQVSEKLERHVAILGDLCGTKIRVGKFPNGSITLVNGERVTITIAPVEGNETLIPSQYRGIVEDVSAGDRLLLNDGMLELEVISAGGEEAQCLVIQGGILRNHKGINLPGIKVAAPALTDKDRQDARFLLDLGVDFLALSFVRKDQDVFELKELIHETGANCHIIAKLENHEGLENVEQILEAADGLMVARGDLGVELKPEQVPVVQDKLVELARRSHKPVIVATQMLESMIENPRPTRAEVSDISHAVASGTDAVMLSAESASGKFPRESVEMMDRICRETERNLWKEGAFRSLTVDEVRPLSIPAAVASSTAQLSRDLLVRGVVVISAGGTSAIMTSSARPSAPIVAATSNKETCRYMNLIWGVVPILVEDKFLIDHTNVARSLGISLGLAEKGEHLLLVRGFHPEPDKGEPSVTVLTA